MERSSSADTPHSTQMVPATALDSAMMGQRRVESNKAVDEDSEPHTMQETREPIAINVSDESKDAKVNTSKALDTVDSAATSSKDTSLQMVAAPPNTQLLSAFDVSISHANLL